MPGECGPVCSWRRSAASRHLVKDYCDYIINKYEGKK